MGKSYSYHLPAQNDLDVTKIENALKNANSTSLALLLRIALVSCKLIWRLMAVGCCSRRTGVTKIKDTLKDDEEHLSFESL